MAYKVIPPRGFIELVSKTNLELKEYKKSYTVYIKDFKLGKIIKNDDGSFNNDILGHKSLNKFLTLDQAIEYAKIRVVEFLRIHKHFYEK